MKTIADIKAALIHAPQGAEFVLDLTAASAAIVNATKQEFNSLLTFIESADINKKIRTIKVNITTDQNHRFLKMMAACKHLANIVVDSLNYHEWHNDRLSTLWHIRNILKNKNLKSLELVNCTTYSSMGEYTPTAIHAFAKHFETITLSNLVLQSDRGCMNFISSIEAYGTKTLKHFTLQDVTLDFNDTTAAEAKEHIAILKTRLASLQTGCASLQSLTVKNIQTIIARKAEMLDIAIAATMNGNKAVAESKADVELPFEWGEEIEALDAVNFVEEPEAVQQPTIALPLPVEPAVNDVASESKTPAESRYLTCYKEAIVLYKKCDELIRKAYQDQGPKHNESDDTYDIKPENLAACKQVYEDLGKKLEQFCSLPAKLRKLGFFSKPDMTKSIGMTTHEMEKDLQEKLSSLASQIYGSGSRYGRLWGLEYVTEHPEREERNGFEHDNECRETYHMMFGI